MGDLGDIQSILCARMSKAPSDSSGLFSPAYRKVAGLMSPTSPTTSECVGMNGLSARGHGFEMTLAHVPQVPRASYPSSARKEVPVTMNKQWSRP